MAVTSIMDSQSRRQRGWTLRTVSRSTAIRSVAVLSLISIFWMAYRLLPIWNTTVVRSAQSGVGSSMGSASEMWYPPANTNINNLTEALTGTGTNGFIYDSSHTPDDLYGTYNWCNMPHVRAKEYPRANAEVELKYVEVIHRHHKRTPYAANSFPVESYKWNCEDALLYFYGQTQGEPQAARAYHEGYLSDLNPFVPSGWIGTCEFPQISAGGLQDSWQHGADLYGVYHDLLGFLPEKYADFSSKVKYRVTNNLITSQVAGMVISGMWDTIDAVPLMVQAKTVDSLEPQYSCPAGSSLFNSIQSSSNHAWQQHLELAAGIYSALDYISGVPNDDISFHASFDHYYDNLSARQCHSKPLPCKLVSGTNSTECVPQDLADTVYRLGNWEYSQIYRDSSASLTASTATFGVWIAELAHHLREVMAGETDVIYYHNIAHDGSVSRLLSILQLEEMVWPGMGSEVIFELYSQARLPQTHNLDEAEDFRVRVLFGGQVLKSSNPSLGVMDMIPVESLLSYFDTLVGHGGSHVKSQCFSED